MSLEAFRRDDHIEDACFVFHGEEDESFGGPGTLPDDHQARVGDAFPVAPVAHEVISSADGVRREEFSQVAHGVAVQRQPGHPVIGVGDLEAGHWWKVTRGLVTRSRDS